MLNPCRWFRKSYGPTAAPRITAEAVAPPPQELLLSRSLTIDRSEAIRELARQQHVPNRDVDELLDALLRGHVPPGAEALAPLLQPSLESVFDYLPDDTTIFVDDPDAGHDRPHHDRAADDGDDREQREQPVGE